MAKILVATDGREWQAWVADDFSAEEVAAVEGSGFFDGVSVYVLVAEDRWEDGGCILLTKGGEAKLVAYDGRLFAEVDGSEVLGGYAVTANGHYEDVSRESVAEWLVEMTEKA